MGRVSFAFGHRLSWRQIGIIAAACLLGVVAFLLASLATGHFGFPLDDSWIHATYARNLALSGTWAFRPGMVSSGSTSPLWTFLLAPGYWMGLAPLWWSHLLGTASLIGLSIVVELAARRLSDRYSGQMPWAGLLVGTEWHLLWAAASGMETLLHTALVTAVMVLLLVGSRRYGAMGLLSGICVWVRPDALGIVPVALLILALRLRSPRNWLRASLGYSLGLGSLLLPYLLMNLSLSGSPLPNTFYAKQAEYAGWQARSITERVMPAILQISSGPLLLLWPALAIFLVRAIRGRDWIRLAVIIWCGAYLMVYVLRLPPYQHGRYIIPILPLLVLFGFLGLVEFRPKQAISTGLRRIDWAWKAGIVLTQLGFVMLGASAYAQDVALIETEMMRSALWVKGQLPASAVVAAHDIGALGYFDDHQLIDLAGLVSPEVIPFIRDQDRLARYLDLRGATHLVAFPDLYPQLVHDSTLVYSTDGNIAPALGQGNMSVYCWRCK